MRTMLLMTSLALGCTAAPEEGPIHITLLPQGDAPVADGLGRVHVEVQLDDAARLFRRDVTLEASGGTFGDATTYRARTPDDGILRVPLRVGRRPGPLRVTAQAGGYATVDDTLTLAPRLPDRLVARPVRPLRADGTDSATLVVDLLAEPAGAHVSEGTRLWFTACDAEPDAQPAIVVEPVGVVDVATDQVRVQVTARALPAVAEETVRSTAVAMGLTGPPDCQSAEATAGVAVNLVVDPFLDAAN